MLNKEITDALRVLNREVNAIQKSTDRYKLMHLLKLELEAINRGEWYLEPEYRTRDLTDVEKAIVKFITSRDKNASDQDVKMNFHLSKLQIEEKFKFDTLDWMEMIMDLEEEFNVEVNLEYENNDTKLYKLVEHIQSMI